jgi:hypothetical protein
MHHDDNAGRVNKRIGGADLKKKRIDEARHGERAKQAEGASQQRQFCAGNTPGPRGDQRLPKLKTTPALILRLFWWLLLEPVAAFRNCE